MRKDTAYLLLTIPVLALSMCAQYWFSTHNDAAIGYYGLLLHCYYISLLYIALYGGEMLKDVQFRITMKAILINFLLNNVPDEIYKIVNHDYITEVQRGALKLYISVFVFIGWCIVSVWYKQTKR